MRLWRKTVVRATLLFSDSGVMVEAYDEYMFSETSPPLVVGKYREIPAPRGAAVFAIQFTHVITEIFQALQTFKLQYYLPQQPNSFLEDYLSGPGADADLSLRAVATGADSLNRDQKRVICTLLSKSDPQAWERSREFRQLLEK